MQKTPSPTSRADAEAWDAQDPFADKRRLFQLPLGVIYLDGNSLGPATTSALERLRRVSEGEWASGLIRSWNDADWINLPQKIGGRIAALIGAEHNEVVICDSVSINLFKLITALAEQVDNGGRIVVEEDEFPTDQYIAQSAARLLSAAFVRAPSSGGPDDVARHGGVLVKSIVNYKTATIADMAHTEACAARGGGGVVWDLSHGTGVIAINLKAHGAKAATGCTYKFLNGGPGAPAFLFASEAIADRLQNPLPGWMGHNAPFAFSGDYAPKPATARFLSGTPPVLSLAALDAALDVFDGIDINDLEVKARRLGDLCLSRAEAIGLSSPSPEIGARRGGHVSLTHPEGYAIIQALIAEGVIGDFRAPDMMRFGFSPLFVRFLDVWDAMDALSEILATRRWDQDAFKHRSQVT